MRIHRLALCTFLGLGACAHANRDPLSTTDDDLTLDRVVLYRNGVGYFERHGKVEGDVLRLRVRKDQINDLLKSLTVVERGSGRAVSVSMPLEPESWSQLALAAFNPGAGNLAAVLDGLRGTQVIMDTVRGKERGRIVMVEPIQDEPDPDFPVVSRSPERGPLPLGRDHRITLLDGQDMRVVRLSKVKAVTLQDGDLAMQLHRRLDASAGEGMFQQVEVSIRLVGAKEHDLAVSYVVPAPLWKPTYRVVLPEEGKGDALLQGWAVVDNTSGEDWIRVRIALTSGEPIAFTYDLHTPRRVMRPDLTESGVRKRARVAVGETTFAEEEPGAEMDDEAEEMSLAGESAARKEMKSDRARRNKKSAPPPPAPEAAAAPEPVGSVAPQSGLFDTDALRRSTQASARADQVSGMTSFNLNERVTVPNGSSTMVAIINESVPAEETFLYRPGGAGIGYEANPYRVVRFKNSTPFVLESGPISIYSGGSFVGEGLSEAVGAQTSATIPFAVEPGILVSSSVEQQGDELRLIKIVRGVLEAESFARKKTTWRVKGQPRDEAYTVLVRHPKAGWNYRLVEPTTGAEELPDGYLVAVPVPAKAGSGELSVLEQTPSRVNVSIWDGRALPMLERLVASTDLGAKVRAQLQPIVDRRREIGRIDTEIDGLRRQQGELDRRAEETRRNLEAIKKDAAASKLRRRLSSRLDEFTRKADEIGRKLVELQAKRLEKKIELEDLLQDLDLTAPPKKK